MHPWADDLGEGVWLGGVLLFYIISSGLGCDSVRGHVGLVGGGWRLEEGGWREGEVLDEK